MGENVTILETSLPSRVKAHRRIGWPRLILLTVFWLIICFFVAGLGSWLTSDAIDSWYKTINKSTWNPPNWIFPVVWTSLFAMMGLAAGRIHWKVGFDQSLAAFLIHLIFNFLWSMLFFYLHQMLFAAIEILILEVMIVTVCLMFWRRDKLAGALLIPYAVWVAFATILNWTIVLLNA